MALERKVAVITGASQGIGASVMEGFRQIGYGVVANSRAIGKTDIVRDSATLLVDGDIAAPDTADRIVTAAIERFGRIDTLVNNAGLFIAKPFLDYSEADFAAMIAVNLAGFFHMSQKVIPWMLRAGAGHVVNITATIAEQPMAALPTSLATLTKAGLNAATRARHRICRPRHPRERRVAGRHRHADASAATARFSRRAGADGPHRRAAGYQRRRALPGEGGLRHGGGSACRWRRLRGPLVGDLRI